MLLQYRQCRATDMNNIEHEAKLLDVNPDEIRQKLKKLGAVKVGEYNFRRYVFDTIPATQNRWVRLRSNGVETTLTVKEIESDAIGGTKEWEVVVSDMDSALIILEKIGINPRGYQENNRKEYSLDGAQVVIDYWPRLDPYVEIEAENLKAVVATAEKLGFSHDDLVTSNTSDLYKAIGIDLKEVAELKFTPGEKNA